MDVTRTFGRLIYGHLDDGPRGKRAVWLIDAEPHVIMRAKRIFPRATPIRDGQLVMSDLPENCAELEWLILRWPLLMSDPARGYLAEQVARFEQTQQTVTRIRAGELRLAGEDWLERGGWGRGAHQPQRSAEGRDAAAGDSAVDWGIYEPAIRRWELILGRAAPPPAARTSRRGGYQLTGEFDEWMMGLAAGHVTDPAIWRGVKRTAARNAQLRLCGNGVVPQQAVEALRRLLPHVLAATQRIG